MSWRYGDTMNRNAGEVSTRRIAPGALCGYMERCLARYSCGDGSDCYGSTVGNAWKVVETTFVECHLPVLAMTADVIQATYEECIKSGMDGYVSKPFDEEQLYQAVSRLVVGTTDSAV
jgi:hypothetical protein